MFLRTSPAMAAFLCSHPVPSVIPATSTSPPSLGRILYFRPTLKRRYATSHDPRPLNGTSSNGSEAPPPWPSNPHPTPYDIFAIPRQGAYSKKRFYQLVKLYHPDTHGHSSSNQKPIADASRNHMSPSVRLQRYHLVIAANDLLSDPNRRHLYDTHGLGWAPGFSSAPNPDLRTVDRSWRDQPGNASANATWEDWEKWHAARSGSAAGDKGSNGPMYMPNSVFATIIAMLCAVGALAQGRRAESAGTFYVDVTAQKHQDVSEGVVRSTMASRGMSQDQRVERFLRDRENVAYRYEPSKLDSSGNAKS